MDKKKSFIIFAPEFLALSNHLTIKQRGELMTALCEMVLYGEPVRPVPQYISKAYNFMAESISENFKKYNEVCEKRKAIATKAASKRRANAEQKKHSSQTTANLNDNENEHNNDIKNKNENSKKEKINKKEIGGFAVPTLEDIKIYCAIRGFSNVDPQAFYDYYKAKNWCVGNIPIRDWQAKIIKWENGGENTSSFASIGDCLRLPKLAQQGGAQ